MKILITGATGNIGAEIIESLFSVNTGDEIIAGVRNIEKSKKMLAGFKTLSYRTFDFEAATTFEAALEKIDVLFLLRPPVIADVKKYFFPLFDAMQRKQVNKIVFLSVQGAGEQKYIPHYKIEQAISDYQFDYVFLRPGYFMQNLTTTLLKEIKEQQKIVVPSGKLKFNWVDVKDVGRVGATIINRFEKHKNRAYDITGSDFENFGYVADLLTEILGFSIKYESPDIFSFFMQKRKTGTKPMMILVMLLLHYLPRFGKNKKQLTTVGKADN